MNSRNRGAEKDEEERRRVREERRRTILVHVGNGKIQAGKVGRTTGKEIRLSLP